jgi:L1 cell adhesion molecule like protein
MVNDAEKYKDEDDNEKNRITARNAAESYAYSLRNTLSEEGIKDKIDAGDKEKLEAAINEMISWLDQNQTASTEEFEGRQKELEAIASPIMMKIYQQGGGAGGPGGMPGGGMPGGFGGDAGGAGGSDGPTVEEVD